MLLKNLITGEEREGEEKRERGRERKGEGKGERGGQLGKEGEPGERLRER